MLRSAKVSIALGGMPSGRLLPRSAIPVAAAQASRLKKTG